MVVVVVWTDASAAVQLQPAVVTGAAQWLDVGAAVQLQCPMGGGRPGPPPGSASGLAPLLSHWLPPIGTARHWYRLNWTGVGTHLRASIWVVPVPVGAETA
ncbi:hypothetical protein CJ030_MR0G007894 [Morella rubra]|uniref:Uncharacterized protein n=1 Tax=Morella rubra TaxID=262757 RepID=A0A6A1UI38_9ROSI|nr:hypothetical protein CJ030_MR0G007894 [Morella rubra]